MMALKTAYDLLISIIIAVCRRLTIAILMALTAVVIFGVFFRYVLNDSLSWYEELAKFLMVYLVFVAAPVALNLSGHVGLDFLQKKLPPVLSRINILLIHLIITAFLVIFVWHSWILTWNARGQTVTTMNLSYFWVYFSMPFGGVMMLLVSFRLLLDQFLFLAHPNAEDKIE